MTIPYHLQPEVQADMQRQSRAYIDSIPAYPAGRFAGRGIVIVGGGKYFIPAYVTIRIIRHLGCTLPIELWSFEGETPADRKPILEPYGVKFVEVDKATKDFPFIDYWWRGWQLKPFAQLNSSFEEVLFLDADCYPLKHPEKLFDTELYRENGCIYWPNIDADNINKWKPFGVYPGLRGTESGQMLLDKMERWEEMNLALWWNRHPNFTYFNSYGDQDAHAFSNSLLGSTTPMFADRPFQYKNIGFYHAGPTGDAENDPWLHHRYQDKAKIGKGQYVSTGQSRRIGNIRDMSIPLEAEFHMFIAELAAILPPEPMPATAMDRCPVGHKPNPPICGLCRKFNTDPEVRKAMESAWIAKGKPDLSCPAVWTPPEPRVQLPVLPPCDKLGPVVGSHDCGCVNNRRHYDVHECKQGHGRVIQAINPLPPNIARSCHACPDNPANKAKEGTWTPTT